MERAVALCDHDSLLPEDLEFPQESNELDTLLTSSVKESAPLEEIERAYARLVLDSRGGNKAEAARVLGINRRTLYRMLDRAGVRT
jgi:DNA-binding NtrC family response regulator